MAMRVFKCPFCGYRFRVDLNKRWESGKVGITRITKASKPLAKERRGNVDLTCPNCEGEFEEEVEV